MNRKQHWETVYATKSDQEVGWFQENPATSIKLVEKYAGSKEVPIIDVGGGNSFLISILHKNNYTNLSVIDIAENAITRNKSRFEGNNNAISRITSNILDFSSEKKYFLWHDRAVFHFLIKEEEINQYEIVASQNIAENGILILGTFSTTGPESCSGLPITQYDKEKLTKVFQHNFELIESFEDVHITPSGNPQNFFWAIFKRQ